MVLNCVVLTEVSNSYRKEGEVISEGFVGKTEVELEFEGWVIGFSWRKKKRWNGMGRHELGQGSGQVVKA